MKSVGDVGGGMKGVGTSFELRTVDIPADHRLVADADMAAHFAHHAFQPTTDHVDSGLMHAVASLRMCPHQDCPQMSR